jgi:CubicO group peptidase (beta-lactamase class C family)
VPNAGSSQHTVALCPTLVHRVGGPIRLHCAGPNVQKQMCTFCPGRTRSLYQLIWRTDDDIADVLIVGSALNPRCLNRLRKPMEMKAPDWMQTRADPAAHGWEVARPENIGMNAARLNEAITAFENASPHDKAEKLIIVHDGELVHAGPQSHIAQGAYSITKTFLSTVFGLLYDDGKFQPDLPVADALPELKPVFETATFGQFLSMTSGYMAVDDDRPVNAYVHGPTRTPFWPAIRAQSAPGTTYSYWDSAPTLLALAGTRLAGEPLVDLFHRRIGEVVGIDIEWGAWLYDGLRVNGGSGNHYGAVQITPFDLAKLGEIYRLDGVWQGTRILSETWCQMATKVQAPAELKQIGTAFQGRGCYGYFWWVQGKKPDGTLKWPGLETHVFSAAGLNNNDLFVLPEHRLTVLRMGHDEDTGFQISDATYAALLKDVIQALDVG